MALINIDDVGAIGVILDKPDYTLPPNAWSSGENVRFFEGKVLKMQGQEAVFGTPTIAPHHLDVWKHSGENRWIYGGVNKVYYTYNSVHYNITRYTTTPGDDDYSTTTRPVWTGGNLHGIPILNHDNVADYPQQWDNTNTRLKDLDNWPVNTYCQIMRPFQNFLVALNITKSAVNYPYTVKWSHPADPGTVPTSWDEADPTKLAGEQTISQSGGYLVDCLPLAGQNILYKSDSIWAMRLAGSQFVFNFTELSSTMGVLSPNCVKEFYRQHFVVGTSDIVLFDGVTPKSIVNKKVRNWFFSSLHPDHFDKTQVTINYPKREIWICFVEAGAVSTYLTRALVWNWDTNTWSTKELPDISFINYGRVVDSEVETFDSSSGTFDTDFGIFNSGTYGSPTELQLLMAKAYTTNEMLLGDSTYQDRGTNYTSYVERLGLAIAGQSIDGSLVIDPASVKFVRSVFLKISAQTSVTVRVYVGMQEVLGGTVTWDGPHDFVIGTDDRVDVAISGRFLCLRIEDTQSLPWEFSGYTLDLDIISRY